MIRLLRNARMWQLALAVYWIALFIATHIPIERVPPAATTYDKVAHLVAFAGLGALFAATWEISAGRLNARHLLRAWFVIMLYAAFEESTQPIVNRHASILDWLADAVGAAIGLLLFLWLRRRLTSVFCRSEA
jgi:VanZ family protein